MPNTLLDLLKTVIHPGVYIVVGATDHTYKLANDSTYYLKQNINLNKFRYFVNKKLVFFKITNTAN